MPQIVAGNYILIGAKSATETVIFLLQIRSAELTTDGLVFGQFLGCRCQFPCEICNGAFQFCYQLVCGIQGFLQSGLFLFLCDMLLRRCDDHIEIVPMRIILKIIAAPAVLALTLIVAVLNFSVSLASWVLGILSLILAVCGLFELFIQSNPQWGITGLVLAFLLSPFGLPAAAEWLVCRLDDLNYSLKTFIAG